MVVIFFTVNLWDLGLIQPGHYVDLVFSSYPNVLVFLLNLKLTYHADSQAHNLRCDPLLYGRYRLFGFCLAPPNKSTDKIGRPQT